MITAAIKREEQWRNERGNRVTPATNLRDENASLFQVSRGVI